MLNLRSFSRWLKPLAVTLIVSFLLITLTPLPVLMTRPLLVPARLQPADVIVVLGSGVYPDGTLGTESLHRTVYGVRLFRQGLAPWIVFAGGRPYPELPSLAEGMAQLAMELGVDARAVVVENTSESTYENARNTRRILVQHGWRTVLLVTSAPHGYRAVRVFRQQGIEVYPAPVAFYESYRFSLDGNWGLFKFACHEYGGLLYYRWRGWL